MEDDINVLVVVKDGHRYLFSYYDSTRAELLRTFGRFAADPELNFTWYDAAVLSKRVREASEAKRYFERDRE